MKHRINIYLFIFAIAFCLFSCITRKEHNVVSIQNDQQNILYSCYANHITVAVENASCDDIILETNNGTVGIDSFRTKGHYIVRPDKLGQATITVKRKKGKSYIATGQVLFRVKRFEVSYGFLGKKKGELSTIELRMGIAPAAVISGSEVCGNYRIDSFTVVAIREGKEIFKRRLYDENGARFDDTTKNFFATVKQQDKILFTGIKYRDLCGLSVPLGDIDFIISNAHEKRPEHGQDTLIDPITGQEVIKKW